MDDQESSRPGQIRRHLAREIVPILALIASILTFGISFYLSSNQQAEAEQRLEAEGVRAAQQEVRELLQQLYRLRPQLFATQDIAEAEAYQKDMTLLASQSYKLAADYSEPLSAFELASVAEALLDTDQYPEADAIVNLAVDRIQTPSEHLFTYRIRGRISFLLGDVEGGRAAFELALSGHPERQFREGYEPAVDAFTGYLWADLEAAAHECEAALQRLDSARGQAAEAAPADVAAVQPVFLAVEQRVMACTPASP
jgi:hypothetical protein